MDDNESTDFKYLLATRITLDTESLDDLAAPLPLRLVEQDAGGDGGV